MPTFLKIRRREPGCKDPQSQFLHLTMELSCQLDVFSFWNQLFLIVIIGKKERSVPVRSWSGHHMKAVILHQNVIAGLLQRL